MVPPLAGLIDHVTDPAWGLLAVTEAVNVIVAPAATLAEAGLTEIVVELGGGDLGGGVAEKDGPPDTSRQPPRPRASQSAIKSGTKVNR